MKRFISGGFITNNDLIENSNCNNNDIDIDKLREKEKEQEDEGFNISNFYKTSTFSLNAKLPERLLKRLPEISKQHSEIIDNNLNLSKTTTNIITTTTTTTTTTEITKKNSFYCCECESEIFNTEKIEHESSTTHILCVRTKEGFVPKRYVSSSLPLNVGYNILSKNMNWCDGEGLGKNNEGKINPIKVEKKNNKLGLGVTTKNNNQVLNYNNNKNNKNNKNNNNIGNYQNKKKKKKLKEINKNRETYIKELL
ncbi:hypothetical protein RB653_008041 [Dictyostelium firmibasis]|uniref:G-patch domain-containing protein n=1 Tax=Dictyostelium firmibasis TaxID=79012 RepID=A0AAN7YQT8_9MYCE